MSDEEREEVGSASGGDEIGDDYEDLAIDMEADADAEAEEDGGMGLTLDLGGDDEEVDDEEARLRDEAGFNSPGKTGDESGDDAEIAITPRTAAKMRADAGINSPKHEKKMEFGGDEDEDTKDDEAEDGGALPSALAGLVTQVKRDAPSGPVADESDEDTKTSGPEGLVTQVERPKTGTTKPKHDTEPKTVERTDPAPAPSSGGLCACFSAIFSCCGGGSSGQTQQQLDSQISSSPSTTRDDAALMTSSDTKAAVTKTEPRTTVEAGTGGTKDAGEGEAGEVDEEMEYESEESSTEYPDSLLPPMSEDKKGKKCMVLDLDETLVHSSFRPVKGADFIIPVEIDGVIHRVYVMKRPFVDEFMVACEKDYEVVIFTASLSKYADPLLDELDTERTISHRLFREHCVLHQGSYVKDLRRLGRKLRDIIIIDNSAASYLFQPKNAVPIASWFDDKTDTQLRDFLPVMESTLANIHDVRWILDANSKTYKWLCQQAHVPLEKYTPEGAKRRAR